jgi:hypothetical protein
MTYPAFTGDFGEEYRLLVDAVNDLKGESMSSELRERIELIEGRFPHPYSELFQSRETSRQEGKRKIAWEPPAIGMIVEGVKRQTIIKLDRRSDKEMETLLRGGIQLWRYDATGPFKPMGLVLWDVDDKACITRMTVGLKGQLKREMPAKMLETKRDFSALKEMAEENKLCWPGDEYLVTECDVMRKDSVLMVTTEGFVSQVAVWGYTVE